ncbi:MAG: hypothetical protein AB1757_16525 [Acidobacteriota bacterium]
MAVTGVKLKKNNQAKPTVAQRTPSRFEVVTETLAGYAERGVFRGFSQTATPRQTNTAYKILWHHNRVFELVFDATKNILRFTVLLPNMPADSEMYADLKRFVSSRHAEEVLEHRRIDATKAQAQVTNRNAQVSLAVKIKDGDDEYAVRKLLHLAHEIFLTFLTDGRYFEYLVENFDLDPDHI